MPFVSAVLLAAGESTRMGTQKALLPWEGVPLLEYQLEQLSTVDDIQQVVVVTGHQPEQIAEIPARFDRVQLANNPRYLSGKVSSVKTGLGAISSEAEAIVLIAVDQPRPADMLRTLVDRHLADAATITVPTHAGRRGHPVIFSRILLAELLAITEATMGIRAVMDRHRADTLGVEFDDPIVLVDLNRPTDVAREHPA